MHVANNRNALNCNHLVRVLVASLSLLTRIQQTQQVNGCIIPVLLNLVQSQYLMF